jgi:hypothetical protein
VKPETLKVVRLGEPSPWPSRHNANDAPLQNKPSNQLKQFHTFLDTLLAFGLSPATAIVFRVDEIR